MAEDVKGPHTSIFSGPAAYGKSHLVLDIIESFYCKRFDCINIIYSRLGWNETYRSKPWINSDKYVC